MRVDTRLVQRVAAGKDLYEGIATVLVDRGRVPKWKHDRVEDVTEEELDKMFAALVKEDELKFD